MNVLEREREYEAPAKFSKQWLGDELDCAFSFTEVHAAFNEGQPIESSDWLMEVAWKRIWFSETSQLTVGDSGAGF